LHSGLCAAGARSGFSRGTQPGTLYRTTNLG